MKQSYWGYWLILFGVFIIGIMMLVNSTSTTNTQDYYKLKEATQAAMLDSVDYSYYRLYGDVKMSEQKFVENFIRRLAADSNLSNNYDIAFYDLYEIPPKVSVKMSTKSNTFNVANKPTDYDVTNTIDAILELPEVVKKQSTVCGEACGLYVHTSLMGHFASSNLEASAKSNSAKAVSAAKSGDFEEFMYEFYRSPYGLAVQTAKPYNDLPQEMKDWISAGYISITDCNA